MPLIVFLSPSNKFAASVSKVAAAATTTMTVLARATTALSLLNVLYAAGIEMKCER